MWWNKILKIILGLAKPLWNFIYPVLQEVGKDVTPEIIALVTTAVSEAEVIKKPTSSKKWQYAFDEIKEGLVRIGKTVPDRTINLLIEAAVHKIHENKE